MQFAYSDPQTELEKLFGGFHCINMWGKISVGDTESFVAFLKAAKPPPRTPVYIDSTGGNVEEAMNIGRLIRDHWFSTDVGQYILETSDNSLAAVKRNHLPGKCLSAATLVYLGGRLRYFRDESEFGVHRFSFANPLPQNVEKSQTLAAQIAKYVEDMGISARFLERSWETSSDELQLLKHDELTELKVVTGGTTDVEWTTHARHGTIYVRGERDSLFGHHKVILGHAAGAGFFFHAVIESLGRETELTSHQLVEITLNDEAKRIDISDRCERAIQNIYTNVVAMISEEEALKIAASKSFGVQIRFADTSEVFLGIGEMSTEGGEDALDTLVKSFKK